MDLIVVIGSGALRKITVGQELMKITVFRLLHNHMMIEPVLEIFGKFDGSVVSRLRDVVFEEFMKTNYRGMIFTFMWAFDMQSDWDYIKSVTDKFEATGGTVYYVELVADRAVRLERNKSENRLKNKASNDEMMPDIMEMSRSVLYGKRGGQYIADALKDSVIVVENKRLKTALLRLRNDLESGLSLDECLDELELSFSNGEISSFCTVIKSLQSTGQVDEALRTLENNIEREQASVNKRRCMILEHKTMMYVIFIAMDLMAMILYCIIMKLLEMQIGF